uniref:Agmatine deiminase n=1 Tax=Rhizophora mucronata TaxID=61149 RepID=A0A2P2K7G3_RHIMU
MTKSGSLFFCHIKWSWHMKLNYLEFPTISISTIGENIKCFLRSFILIILLIIRPRQQNHTRPHKTAHIINVTIGIIITK